MPANATFTELVSTTYRKHKGKFADNVTNNNALFSRMARKGRTRTVDGGLTIVEELDYAENGTYQRYSGYDTLNISPSDVLSAAEYPWKQSAVHITASGRELRINSGKQQIINLVKSRMQNAMRTFKNSLSADIYSDGTASNQVNGLQAIIPDVAGGTLGGIDGGTQTFWQGVVQSAASPIGGGGPLTLDETTIEAFMLELWLELVRGSDRPDLIVMSNDYFTLYEQSQVSLKRYTTDTTGSGADGSGGFVSLKYKTADVIFDGGSGIPAAHAYFLNTDYMSLVVHPDANMSEVESERPTDQDASVTPIIWMGNVCCSNRSLQGVAKA